MENRTVAVSFMNLILEGRVDEAYEKHVSDNFKHHNPFFQGDRISLMNGMKENAVKSPNKIFDIKLVLEDKDFVAVHSHIKQNTEDAGVSVVHIFRFKYAKIVELWDVGQLVVKNSINGNGMF